jgi:hypothetical protein
MALAPLILTVYENEPFCGKKRMMLMLEIMKLHALKAWILWLRNRYQHRHAMLIHHHGVLFPQTGLVRSQRKKT